MNKMNKARWQKQCLVVVHIAQVPAAIATHKVLSNKIQKHCLVVHSSRLECTFCTKKAEVNVPPALHVENSLNPKKYF